MPDSAVVHCGKCGHFQVIPQLLPAIDEYFNCDKCSSKHGEPLRQPCTVHRMPDGSALRSYDIKWMRVQAKKLNAVATLDQQDARMSSQKSRIMHTLEEQRLRRIQERCKRLNSRRRTRSHRARVRPQIKEKLRTGDITEQMIAVLEQENTVKALFASRDRL